MAETDHLNSIPLFEVPGERVPLPSVVALALGGTALAICAALSALPDIGAPPDARATSREGVQVASTPAASPANQDTAHAVSRLCSEGTFVPFAFGSAHPEEAQVKSAMDPIVHWLNEHSAAKVDVEGHADTTGSDQPNLLLSYERAKAIAAALQHAGIAAPRVLIAAAGSQNPVAGLPGESQANRRVYLRIRDPINCQNSVR